MPFASLHHAAVRSPRALPSDRQRIVPLRTRTWPVTKLPRGPPRKRTSWSRAWIPLAVGHGWLGLQVSSISRAAIPASRSFGPSAHQIGPSPSHTAVGVHVNVMPAATTSAAKKSNMPQSVTLIATSARRSFAGPALMTLSRKSHELLDYRQISTQFANRPPAPWP